MHSELSWLNPGNFNLVIHVCFENFKNVNYGHRPQETSMCVKDEQLCHLVIKVGGMVV